MSIRGDDILCTPLYYICLIRVLDGVVKLQGVAIMGRGTKKVETHGVRKTLHSVTTDDCKHNNHTQKCSECVISCHSVALSLVWCRVLL